MEEERGTEKGGVERRREGEEGRERGGKREGESGGRRRDGEGRRERETLKERQTLRESGVYCEKTKSVYLFNLLFSLPYFL